MMFLLLDKIIKISKLDIVFWILLLNSWDCSLSKKSIIKILKNSKIFKMNSQGHIGLLLNKIILNCVKNMLLNSKFHKTDFIYLKYQDYCFLFIINKLN
jgi:hypothetical protein